MKFIIEHHKDAEKSNKTKNFEIVSLSGEALEKAKRQEKYIEMDFEMTLGKSELPFIREMAQQSILLATLGKKQKSERVDAYYDMNQHIVVTKKSNRSIKETYWVSCYGEGESTTASHYIETIKQLVIWAKAYQKSLIIYSEITPRDVHYKYRSLTSKIVNTLLKEVKGVLVIPAEKKEMGKYYKPSHKAFEFYLDETIYLSYDYRKGMSDILKCFNQKSGHLKNIYRQREPNQLYSDLFYTLIPDTEKIYVPLNLGISLPVNDFKALGFEIIRDFNNYGFLYGTKSSFNQNSDALKKYVLPNYTLPVLERGGISSMQKLEKRPYEIVAGETLYRGKNVYIALVSNTGVDYRASYLRKPDGTSRIAGIWEQRESNKGTFYSQEQINRALQSDDPNAIVPIEVNDELNTMLLGIAGGKDDTYEGVATEAEFLIAKVNSAPEVLQEIYGGNANAQNILMPDLLIGIWQLQNVALKEGKSTVFYIPYYTNIDAHDGIGFYNALIANIGTMNGYAVVAPTGEEGDKGHHHTFIDLYEENPIVNFVVSKSNQNIVGIVTQRYLADWQVFLYTPSGETIDMTKEIIYESGESIIYSQGEKVKYYTGTKEILWRIENMVLGQWRMELIPKQALYNRMDLWISGERFNPSVRLQPQDPYITIGSIGNITGITSIAGYDMMNMVALKASGRGYTADDRIQPIVAASGVLETINLSGDQVEVVGTEVSGMVMTGMVAAIFEKWQIERENIALNGPLLNSILSEYVTRIGDTVFPNPNQGLGVFTQESIRDILMAPFD